MATYPDAASVLSGTVYGPNDNDYTGTLAIPSANDVADAVWGGDRTVRGLTEPVDADVTAISGDADAADYLEAMLDGTGAVLYLTKLQVHASSGVAVSVQTSDGSYPAFYVYNSSGSALQISATGGMGVNVTSNQIAVGLYSGSGYAPFGLVQDSVSWLLPSNPGTVDGKTFQETMRLISAVLCGKASGLNTNSPVYRDMADSKDRVSATTDADGNRSAVTLDAT